MHIKLAEIDIREDCERPHKRRPYRIRTENSGLRGWEAGRARILRDGSGAEGQAWGDGKPGWPDLSPSIRPQLHPRNCKTKRRRVGGGVGEDIRALTLPEVLAA